MTNIEFFFDPTCPFSWITSRWLVQVQAKRDLDITWRQFSLALKNDSLSPKKGESSHAAKHRASHRVHRVISRAANVHGANMINLYSEFGIRYHTMDKSFDDETILEVLESLKLPEELVSAADDTSLDPALQAELDSAIEIAGEDIGVPTIVFTATDNSKLGYFGPVLNELPSDSEESLRIWDGLEKLATTPSFYELKRNRPAGGPDIYSAARC